MSYDISLCDPDTGKVVELRRPHGCRGGTYAVGGTNEAWLNVTYNYAKHFYRVLGDKGLRGIYGMTGADSVPILTAAIEKLENDVDDDYWKATEGNARHALEDLRALALMAPHAVWDGD